MCAKFSKCQARAHLIYSVFQFHSDCSTLFNEEHKNNFVAFFKRSTIATAREGTKVQPRLSSRQSTHQLLQRRYFIIQPSASHSQTTLGGITDILALFASALSYKPKTPSLFSLCSLKADLVRLHGRKNSNVMNLRRSEQDRW